MAAPSAAEIAALAARLKTLEDHKLDDRLDKLERFQTGVTWAIAAVIGFFSYFGGFLRTKLGLS